MPEISRFFGIIIQMYYNDHEPPISMCAIPVSEPSLRSAIWLCSLLDDWALARADAELRPIPPLE